MLKTAVEIGGLSDHRPITLSITIPEEKPPTHFKFNLVWLENEDYREMVKKNWKLLEVQSSDNYMYQMMDNLSTIKKLSKEWGKKFRESEHFVLKDSEKKIQNLYKSNATRIFST